MLPRGIRMNLHLEKILDLYAESIYLKWDF